MHFVVFEAHPKPQHAEYGRIDGAFVSAFVNEAVPAAAEAMAREFIEEQGWDIVVLDQSYPVDQERFELESESREHFDQALVDGIVVTFHRWPVGAPDEEEQGPVDGAA